MGSDESMKSNGNINLGEFNSTDPYNDLLYVYNVGNSELNLFSQMNPDDPVDEVFFRPYEVMIFKGNILNYEENLFENSKILKTGLKNDAEYVYLTDNNEPEIKRISLNTGLPDIQKSFYTNLTLDFKSNSPLWYNQVQVLPFCLTELDGICLACIEGFHLDPFSNKCNRCNDTDVYVQIGRFCKARGDFYQPDPKEYREKYFPSTDQNSSTENIFFVSEPEYSKSKSNITNFWDSNFSLNLSGKTSFFTVKVQLFDLAKHFSPNDYSFPAYFIVSSKLSLLKYSFPGQLGYVSPDFQMEFSYTIFNGSSILKMGAFFQMPNYLPYTGNIVSNVRVDYFSVSQNDFLALLQSAKTHEHLSISAVCQDNQKMQFKGLHWVKCVSENNIDFGYTTNLTIPQSVIGCLKNCKKCSKREVCLECEKSFFLSGNNTECIPCDHDCTRCQSLGYACDPIVIINPPNPDPLPNQLPDIVEGPTSESRVFLFKNNETIFCIINLIFLFF